MPLEDCAAAGDEDGDGDADCADSDCSCTAPLYGVPLVEDCAAAGDEDLDGYADCNDPDCNDAPACVPAPKGAIRIAPTSGNCGIGPYLIPAEGTLTTATAMGTRVEDGDGAEVACAVTSTADGFAIEAQIMQGATSAAISGTVSPGEAPANGTGTLSFYNPDSGNVEGAACTLTVSASQRIQPGAVWGSMRCTAAHKPATGQTCDVAADFVFESCDGAPRVP